MNTITRKEIAAAAEISEDTVAKKEKLWGLDSCRAKGRDRPVAYWRAEANLILLGLQVIKRAV